tara:strand:+ start:3953 stop:4603 length:651 start_codon:yes stop_codon:yes gene_type:complete
VAYTISSDTLVGAGGIVNGWLVPPYASGVPTVAESASGLDISSVISPNHVRPTYDKQWANTGPGIMLPDLVMGDFDLQVKLSSASPNSYLLAGPCCWYLNVNSADHNGHVGTARGYYNATRAYRWGASIGNGCRRYTKHSGWSLWADTEWVRLQRVGPMITHSYKVADADPWTLIEEQTWDRAGGNAWLGIGLGSNNGQTASITVHKIVGSYTAAP